MNFGKVNMSSYKLLLSDIKINISSNEPSEITLELRAPYSTEFDLDELGEDITFMNTIRSTSDPTIIDQYEKLLSVIKLKEK